MKRYNEMSKEERIQHSDEIATQTLEEELRKKVLVTKHVLTKEEIVKHRKPNP